MYDQTQGSGAVFFLLYRQPYYISSWNLALSLEDSEKRVPIPISNFKLPIPNLENLLKTSIRVSEKKDEINQSGASSILNADIISMQKLIMKRAN